MVTNYNPRKPDIRNLILPNWNIISNGTDCGNLFPKPPILGYRQLPNLRDLITNAEINYPEETNQDTGYKPKSCMRLGKCTYCPLIKKPSEATCNFTNTTYRCINLPKRITCEINNIIYLITCSKCNMVYVGETCREFRNGYYEHRNSVLKPKLSRSTPVSRHFTSDNHRVSTWSSTFHLRQSQSLYMEFSVLEWCTPKFGPNETGLRRRTY